MNSIISSFKTNSTVFSGQKFRAPIICADEISKNQLKGDYNHFTNTCSAIYLNNNNESNFTASEIRHKIETYEISAPDFELWVKSGLFISWNPILQCLDLSFSEDSFQGMTIEQKNEIGIVSKFPVIKKSKESKISKKFNELVRISKTFEKIKKSKKYYELSANSSVTESVKSVIVYPFESAKKREEENIVENIVEYEDDNEPREIINLDTKKELVESWLDHFDRNDAVSFSELLENQDTINETNISVVQSIKNTIKKNDAKKSKTGRKKRKNSNKTKKDEKKRANEHVNFINEPIDEQIEALNEPIDEQIEALNEPIDEQIEALNESIDEKRSLSPVHRKVIKKLLNQVK